MFTGLEIYVEGQEGAHNKKKNKYPKTIIILYPGTHENPNQKMFRIKIS